MTDVTNASRTNLMNLDTQQWDDELLDMFEVKRRLLPEIRSSAEVYGTIAEGPLAGVPIAGAAVAVRTWPLNLPQVPSPEAQHLFAQPVKLCLQAASEISSLPS